MARPAQVTVEIVTSSQVWQNPPPEPGAQFPQISLNGTAIPQDGGPTQFPSGVQVVTADLAGDLSDPANITSNYLNIVWASQTRGWYDTYRYMWDNVANQIYGAGDPQQQLVFVATFGMDLGMFPTPAAVELLLTLGAGPQLQAWINSATPSESGGWVDYPTDYVLVGQSGYGYGQGAEKFDFAGGELQPVKTDLSVTLQNNPEPPA